MEENKLKVQHKKFFDIHFLKNKTNLKIWRITFISIFAVLFVLITFFSIVSNGYRFIFNDKDYIISNTLLKTLIGLLCGFGLTAAGCAMQGVTRNDLAGPTTMGFMPASTLGIMVYQIVGISSIPLMLFFSFIFAFAILLLGYITLKTQKNNSRNYKMILVGVIVGALLTTISTIMTEEIPTIKQSIIPWIGTVTEHITWEAFYWTTPLILISIVMIGLISNNLNIIENDPSLAKSLGLNAEATFWIAGISSILITISSVYLIGSVALLGMVMPHIIRIIFRTRNYKFLIPVAGFTSATIMIFSLWINGIYTLGLNLFAVVVSVPVFLMVIFKRKNE